MISRITALFAFTAAVASAQIITLVETGGTFRVDATNVAAASNGATAIGLNELGLGHLITNINNGTYGNSSSWIGANDGFMSWVGMVFSGATTVSSFAFGRDNTGSFTDRANDVFTLQYTTDSVTAGTAAAANWVTLDSVDHFGFPPPSPASRHLYNLTTPLNGVTAFRIAAFGGISAGQAIDEIEVYATSAVPEPSTYAAFAGLAALGLVAWRRRAAVRA